MSVSPPANRPHMALDLTRWNRAGLERFAYVDGDAAVWLEELRIAMLSLYLRDSEAAKQEQRTPEYWRDLLLEAVDQWPTTQQRKAALAALDWQGVFTDFPADRETAGKRNGRLLEQYGRRSSDYTWEMLRGFARAAHVLLGHLDAYANEGYLRTATQWDNVRRLAAMVNYQPTPPASATASVALVLDTQVDLGGDSVIIDRGLAMKYAPPEGGAPLVFETLQPVDAHADLSAARAVGWDYNALPLPLATAAEWSAPEKATLAPGDLVVLASALAAGGEATSIATVGRNDETGVASLTFEPPPAVARATGEALLFTEPADVRVGLPNTGAGGSLVVQVIGAAGYALGSVVEVAGAHGAFFTTVSSVADGYLHLATDQRPSGEVTITALTRYDRMTESGYDFETPPEIDMLYFKRKQSSGGGVIPHARDDYRESAADERDIASQFHRPAEAEVGALGFAHTGGRGDLGKVVDGAPEIIPGHLGSPSKTVRFAGEPPKGLTVGDWFAARPVDGADAESLQVQAVRTGADLYYVEFDKQPPAAADLTEFFGPMTRRLRPLDWNRSQAQPVIGGEVTLAVEHDEARRLLKAGRTVLVVEDSAEEKLVAAATLISVEDQPGGQQGLVKVTLDGEEGFAGWRAGWTSFHLNVVGVSHGETKGSKVLGSGDGERARQTFQFGVRGVSFIPSSASSTGVIPDIDVSVDGQIWAVSDDGDPSAEESRSYSVVLNEDDTLEIRFRRRLASGNNNVIVSRHRLGVGSSGTGVPAWSFAKPMKKHRYVIGLVQPFATTGGADREPVSDMRTNAPAKLAANDRAVSLADFERLCRRHSSVWQARARQVLEPGPSQLVSITVVPANGGATTEKLRGDLIDFVVTRALPGSRVRIEDYESIPVVVQAKAVVDTDRFDKEDVRDAAEAALVAAFSLKQRALGQPFYVAEILAALERVEGVSSAVVGGFSARPGSPQPLGEASVGGTLATIFPKDGQVVVVDHAADVAVTVESLVP